MMHDPKTDLAVKAVREACRVTQALQDNLREMSPAATKGDRSPVTVADFSAQAVVARHLGVDFVGEEKAELLEQHDDLRAQVAAALTVIGVDAPARDIIEWVRLGEGSPSSSGFWTLDPVDGTKGFLRGAQYCVSLAWIQEGVPVLGVLGCPRFSAQPGAIEGSGAVVWAAAQGRARISSLEADGPGVEFLVRQASPGDPVGIAESVEAAHSEHEWTPRLMSAAGIENYHSVRLDSQVKYAAVARGDAQLLLRKPHPGYIEKIWDHAAGALVAEAAGCTVSDLQGRTLDFGQGRRLSNNHGIIVAPHKLHQRLLDAVSRVSEE